MIQQLLPFCSNNISMAGNFHKLYKLSAPELLFPMQIQWIFLHLP
uniref:Uncharacterized protein n=1 Tax=Rhizophora mucronata TaxID=61149 RepID=A0A2P2N1R4_RHIMU